VQRGFHHPVTPKELEARPLRRIGPQATIGIHRERAEAETAADRELAGERAGILLGVLRHGRLLSLPVAQSDGGL